MRAVTQNKFDFQFCSSMISFCVFFIESGLFSIEFYFEKKGRNFISIFISHYSVNIHCFDKQIKKPRCYLEYFFDSLINVGNFTEKKNSLIYWILLWKKGCMHIYAWVCAIFISPIVVLKTRFDHSWPYNPFDERFNIYFPAFCRRFFLRPFILAG